MRTEIIAFCNGWHQGRHKKYDLAWTNLSYVPGQKRPDLNRVFKQNTEQNIYFKKAGEDFSNPEAEAKTLLDEYGDKWRKRFACLDGLSGRPTVQESVEQALNHSARHKNKDLRFISRAGWSTPPRPYSQIRGSVPPSDRLSSRT